jgi:hypothetical protein
MFSPSPNCEKDYLKAIKEAEKILKEYLKKKEL